MKIDPAPVKRESASEMLRLSAAQRELSPNQMDPWLAQMGLRAEQIFLLPGQMDTCNAQIGPRAGQM